MATETFTILGDVNVQITITELDNGTLQFDIDVLDDTGSIGDLNAIYFDMYDDSLAGTLTATGTDVSGTAFKADGVTKVSNFTNMNGEVINDLGKFDGGVQFGTQGISQDDIQSTSFILSSSTTVLTLADFSMQDFGIRLTSVGEMDGAREDSLKLGGTAPEFDDPEPPFLACDDTFVATELATFNDVFEPVDTFEFNLLDNNADATSIVSITDQSGNEVAPGTVVQGSGGGWIIINADGSFDFAAVDEFGNAPFEFLPDDAQALTEFTYTMDNGQSASLCVTINGIGDDGGGPIGGFDPGDPGGSF